MLRSGFRLGDRTVRPMLGTVSGPAGSVRVEPKQMDLLVCLAERVGEVVPKALLLQLVWPETFVSEVGLKRNVCHLRRALGDRAEHPQWIQTIPKRGYRLLGPCQALRSRKDRGSIAVLAFAQLGQDSAADPFGEAVAEEVRARLASRAGLRVASRTSSSAWGDESLDAREIARRLDVGWLLEGCVRREGARMRITVDLVDGGSGLRSRSWRFTGDRAGGFRLQDEIAEAVAGHFVDRRGGDSIGPRSFEAPAKTPTRALRSDHGRRVGL